MPTGEIPLHWNINFLCVPCLIGQKYSKSVLNILKNVLFDLSIGKKCRNCLAWKCPTLVNGSVVTVVNITHTRVRLLFKTYYLFEILLVKFFEKLWTKEPLLKMDLVWYFLFFHNLDYIDLTFIECNLQNLVFSHKFVPYFYCSF